RRGQRGVHARGGQESRGRTNPNARARQRARAGTVARDRRRGHRSVDVPRRLGWGSVHLSRSLRGGARSCRGRRARRVAALARQLDAGLHVRDIVTLDDIVAQEQVRMVVGSVVFGSVLLVALVFSAAGLYALMAVAVARRTREIGIRLALGANPRHVLGNVFARAGRQLGGGIIAGNSLILLLAWRADSLTADLLVSSV